jgi:hypothetical protein
MDDGQASGDQTRGKLGVRQQNRGGSVGQGVANALDGITGIDGKIGRPRLQDCQYRNRKILDIPCCVRDNTVATNALLDQAPRQSA